MTSRQARRGSAAFHSQSRGRDHTDRSVGTGTFKGTASMILRNLGAALLLSSIAACASAPDASNLKPGSQAVAVSDRAAPAHLAAGEATLQAGRFSEAMQIFQEILASDPKAVGAQYGAAECLLGLGKAGDARPIFEALTPNPEFRGRALQGEGLSFLTLGKREQAAQLLREATEADPALWRAWNGLGLLADLQRQPGEAGLAYAHALAISPNSAVLHNNLGYSRLLAGKSDEALTEFRKAYGLDPDSETIQNNIRLALAVKGNYAAAVRGAPDGRLATVLNNVGYIAMQRGDLAVAEGYLARAMESSASFNTVASQNIEQLKAK